MDSRPLRDVFAEFAGNAGADPAGLLRDLPDDLVAEAVVSYADTAPAEVAEHLAPFVSAHSVVGPHDPAEGEPGWLDLLATAPVTGDTVTPETDDTDLGFGTGATGDDIAEAEIDLTDDGLLDFPAETTDTAETTEMDETDLSDSTVDWPEIDDTDDPDDTDDVDPLG